MNIEFEHKKAHIDADLASADQNQAPDGAWQSVEENRIGNRELPIWDKMPEIVSTLKDEDRLILVSETGSGKTTQVPQALWEAGFADGGTIYVVENRVPVAIETARRVADEMGVSVGQEVGYLTGPEKKARDNSQIVFLTAGVFKHIVRNDPTLEEASVVLFDEFDERYLLMDIGASLVEKAQDAGSNAKFVLMSATLNAEKFSNHFGGAPVVEAKGRPFPVDAHFADRRIHPSDMPHAAADLAREIHADKDDGDILIFMPGKGEIAETIAHIQKDMPEDVSLLSLHSEVSEKDRRLIFDKSDKRKIIVSTNIAERGLTIDGVRYVIDSGLVRMNEYDPETDTTKLMVMPTAQDSLIQRKGRAGRTQPGECFYLITEDEFGKRPVSTKPEVQRASLRDVVLQIKAMGYSREEDPLRLVDAPEKQNWQTAKDQLRLLGALDENDETKLSDLGQKMAELSCDPREGAMLLQGADMGCGREAAIIAAIRTSRRLFYRPQGEARDADFAHEKLKPSVDSDLLNLLHVYQQVEKSEKEGILSQWCRDNFVSWIALREVKQNAARLTDQVKKLGYQLDDGTAEPNMIRKAIYAGFSDKVFKSVGRGWYEHVKTGERARLGRESTVWADMIVANELIRIQTRKGGELPLITLGTKIDKEWIEK